MEPAAEGYVPLSSRSTWAQRALLAVAALNCAAAVSAYFAYRLYQDSLVTQDELDATDIREGLIALLAFVALVVAAVFFIRWIHRAYRNLPSLGARLRFEGWWAIGGWFIPIWGLFRPKQIANDIWRNSDPSTEPDEASDHVPALFQWWWAFFLVGTFLENAGLRADLNANDLEAYSNLAVLDMVTDSIDAVGALLAVLVVRRTTARMEARAARLRAEPVAST